MTGRPSPGRLERVPAVPSAGRPGRRGVRVVALIAVALALVAGSGFAWRAWATRPQGEPQAVEFADAQIGPELAGATVLALGEATHGNAEFQDLRTALARALPQFRTIALEERAEPVAAVDAFVQGGPGTAAEAASRFGFALNRTEQMAAFLQFVRDRNAALPASQRTRLVGIDVEEGRDLDAEKGGYAAARARVMAANLARVADERAADGHPQVLLFAHAGHVEKTGAAFPAPDLGELAVQRWGESYRVIGTEFVVSRFRASDGERRREFTVRNPTPLRGMFAGTRVGYLEMAAASPANATLLHNSVPMGSAGDQFADWMAWVPPLHAVSMVPANAYDALILVADATPATPLAP